MITPFFIIFYPFSLKYPFLLYKNKIFDEKIKMMGYCLII